MDPPLSSLTDREVRNVVVFVSDSLRYDALPDRIAELGVHGRAAAASTFTASGYPSILTGQYPSTHQVWNFEETLREPPALLTRHGDSGIDASTVWENVDDPARKPPLRIPGVDRERTLSELSPPFVHLVHDLGGHMIYGPRAEADRWADHGEFFDAFAGRPEAIRRRYHSGVEESVTAFLDVIEQLRSRGLLAETLVVFTSDHGELLGEYGGLYTHGAPLVPELVDVPLVFAGAGLPEDVPIEGLLSTTDVAPTALSALGAPAEDVEGRDCWTEPLPADRVARTEVWKQTSYPGVRYRASAVWMADGGTVRRLDPPSNRLAHLLGLQLYYADHANMVRRPWGYRSLARTHLRRTTTYGDPPPPAVVEEHLVTEFSRRGDATDRPAPDRAQLRELGYLE